ncbi:MAG TPA: DUF3352 domain-containing protein [Mycobacteriales bacterium]|nr:DUF3352 domain-containing protein [Mycobacteriales bacterium]
MSEDTPDQGGTPDPYAAPQQPGPGQPPYGEPGAQAPGYGSPAPGQPPYGQPVPPDQSGYGQPAYGGPMGYQGPPTRSRRGAALGAGALVLTLVAGAGVYAASRVDGGGTQPEELVPASAFAFGKLDLDPAADQKVAIREFASKFPEAPKPRGDENITDALLKGAFDQDKCVDFETDIKPWLGDRVGMAGITGTDGKPVPLVLVQVKDEAKLRAVKGKLDGCDKDAGSDELKGLTFAKGYAVFSNTQADSDGAVKAAAKASLKDADNFNGDLAKLDGNQVVVMWADLERSFNAASKGSPELGMVPNGVTKYLKGRVVMGVHMEGDYAEVYGQTIGGNLAEVYGADAFTGIKDLGALPANTVAAMSINGLETYVTKMLDQFNETGMPVDDFFAQFKDETGLDVRKDIIPLLGSKTTFAIGGDLTKLMEDPRVGVKSVVKDPANAKKVGAKLVDLAGKDEFELESSVDGETFYLTTKGYTAELKAGGLGDTPQFKKAMGDLGDGLVQGVYVNIAEMMKAVPESDDPDDAKDMKSIEPLSAFGASVGKKDNDAFFRYRLVVR